MGGPVDLFGGGVLTAIVLAALGALLLLAAIGAFLLWRRRPGDEPTGPTPRNARLAVSETAPVTGGRRLVLVRRDNVEHLLLIGGPHDVVVESSIVRQRAAAPGPRVAAARPAQPQALRPAAATPSAAAPVDKEVRAVDPAVQERLRAASTALALRQAAALPAQADHPAQADQPVGKSEQVDPQVPPSSAVAGLAAGVAALTAAAGSRARAAPAEDGKAEPPAASTNGESIADEEPGRAAFGLRGTMPAPSAADETKAAGSESNEALASGADAGEAHPPEKSLAQDKAEPQRPPEEAAPRDEAEPQRPPQETAAQDDAEPQRAPEEAASQDEAEPQRPPEEAASQDDAEPSAAAAPQPREVPVSPASAAAPRPQGGAAPLSGFAPGRGTTLGDLAERLEEALIQQAATGADAEPGQPGAAHEALPPSPAPPQRDEGSASGQRPPAGAAERDEAAIIDFAARRRPGNESLEEEMARLLGELTQDTTRR